MRVRDGAQPGAARVCAAVLAGALLAIACGGEPARRGLEAIEPGVIEAHLRFLSSDWLEGRAPGTRGADLARAYIAGAFELAGLRPGVGDSSYFQAVPMVARRSEVRLRFRAPGGAELAPESGPEFVAWSTDTARADTVQAELVYVGYGISAPDRDWDDFKGTDVSGKVLLVLPGEPSGSAARRFEGDTLTYYGFWRYKLEEAVRRGAAGVLFIYTPLADHDWDALRRSRAGRTFDPEPGRGYRGLPVVAWLNRPLAEQVAAIASLDFRALLELAESERFRPVSTGVTVRAQVASRVEHVVGYNVAALLPGRDPERSGEVVVYVAHYDHLGIGEPVGWDSIYNGAYDNASGTAALLALAEAFARLPRRPLRSLLFLAVTGGEWGQLGSGYYVEHPLYPLDRTVAAFDLEGVNLWGPTKDIAVIGVAGSGLGPAVERAARAEGLRLEGDREPARGGLYRSDAFGFLRAGVPALQVAHGLDFVGRMPDWGARLLEQFEAERYHRPGDEFSEDFDLRGAVQQVRVAFRIGLEVAESAERPVLGARVTWPSPPSARD